MTALIAAAIQKGLAHIVEVVLLASVVKEQHKPAIMIETTAVLVLHNDVDFLGGFFLTPGARRS